MQLEQIRVVYRVVHPTPQQVIMYSLSVHSALVRCARCAAGSLI